MTEPHGAAALRKFLDNTSSLHPKTKARLLADLSAAERDASNAALEEAARVAEYNDLDSLAAKIRAMKESP